MWGAEHEQVAGRCCVVAEVCEDAGEDRFVIVGLQRWAAMWRHPIYPRRAAERSVIVGFLASRHMGAAHTQACGPYLNTGTVPRQTETYGPNVLTWGLHPVPGGPQTTLGPRGPGEGKFPVGFHQLLPTADFQRVPSSG